MLDAVANWFDAYPDGFWWLICGVLGPVLWLLLRGLLKLATSDDFNPDYRWGWVIAILLFVGRWPTWLVTREYNQDESHLLAGFFTLRGDPVFWRSVDGLTTGPLDYYILFATGWFPATNPFFALRITAAVLLLVTLLFMHVSLSVLYGRRVARVASFGAICVESFSLHADLLHHSTELLPVALLSLAFWLAVQRLVLGKSRWLNLAGGFLLGCTPFAKLQGGPIACAAGIVWVIHELVQPGVTRRERGRNVALLVMGAVAPLVFALALIAGTGIWYDAKMSYFAGNVEYVNDSSESIRVTVARLVRNLLTAPTLIGLWLAMVGVWVLATLGLDRDSAYPRKLYLGWSILLLVVAGVCVAVPHRPFIHYAQFLVIPATLVFGGVLALTGDAARPPVRRVLLLSALFVSVIPILWARAISMPPYAGLLSSYREHPWSALSLNLLQYAKPGESLGIWGWRNSCYAETGLRQATREVCTFAQLQPGPLQTYFKNRYLNDLQHALPPVFIDTTGPGGFGFDLLSHRHEQQFPALAAFIARNYTLVAQPEGVRLYVRKDRVAPVNVHP